MEFKGSKGEWRVQSDGFLVSDETREKYAVGKVYSNPQMGEEEFAANSRLIESAPSLLEVLIHVYELDTLPADDKSMILNAIKRATL